MTSLEHRAPPSSPLHARIRAAIAWFSVIVAAMTILAWLDAPAFARTQAQETSAVQEVQPAQQQADVDSTSTSPASSAQEESTLQSPATPSMTSGVASTSIGLAFVLWGLLCVLLLLAGLPGTWLLLATAVAIDCVDWMWLDPTSPLTFHPITILVCAVLAGIGELLEFLLSAAGAKRFGASARGMWGSVIGGMLGAIVGSFMLPIIGTILGAALGTAAGAIVGELSTAKRTLGETVKPAMGAVIGRILGTLAKLPIALTVWVVLAIAVFA